MTVQNVAAAGTAARQHANAEVVRRGYEAFNTGDMEALTRIFDESASWHTPGRGILAGDQKGRDATFAHFGRYAEDTGGTFKAELRYVAVDEAGRVIGVHRNTAERNGKQLDADCCITFEVENGRITDGREHFYDLHAWDAFWS